jgi:hypothetical protein
MYCSSRANGGYSGTAYDRWVEERGNENTNKSTITKMQHHYWVTKQTVFRKLGKKDDDCIVASDAELDAKLELFRSVQDSCLDLQRIIDKYQERLCSKNSQNIFPSQTSNLVHIIINLLDQEVLAASTLPDFRSTYHHILSWSCGASIRTNITMLPIPFQIFIMFSCF